MKKTAILLADGFEEIEALGTVDILRRAGMVCDMTALADQTVTGAHGVKVSADALLGDRDLTEYDMVIVPGGLPGATTLRDDPRVIRILQAFAADPAKKAAAICAAPIAFGKAGILQGKKAACYPDKGLIAQLTGAQYVEEGPVVVDGNIITSRGPATMYAFAYRIVDELGCGSGTLKEDMLFSRICK